MEQIPSFSKVFFINVGIYILYSLPTLAIPALTSGRGFISNLGFYLIWGYVIHAIILFIAAFVKFFKQQYQSAGQYALTAITILIVGFGICFYVVVSNF